MPDTKLLIAITLICLGTMFLGCPASEHEYDDTVPAEIEGDEAGECDDGVDNDQDGSTDCDDDGCENATACTGDDDTGDDDSAGDDDDTTGAGCAPCGGTYVVENSSQLDEVALCESISGSLTISHADWFTSLDLPCLATVGGNVVIDDNSAMTTIEIPLLVTVGGSLNITENAALNNLDGLPSLTSVGDDLNIYNNDCLNQSDAEVFAAGLTVGAYSQVTLNGDNYPCP